MPQRICPRCTTLHGGPGQICPACRTGLDRARGTTTQRGYGSSHRRLREQYVAAFTPGDPCAHCGKPMAGPASQLDLAHTDDRSGYRGLAHSECNRGNK